MLPKNSPGRRRLISQVNEEVERYTGFAPRLFHFLNVNLGLLCFSFVPYRNPQFLPEMKYQLTDSEAFVNLLKCILGTGVLALPRAYCNTGWLLGLAGSVLISSLLLYAMHVLLNDINLTRKRYKMTMLSYSETMHLAILNGPYWIRPLSKYFARQVDAFLCIYHFGVDVVYVVFIGKNLKELGDDYLPPIDTRIYIALMTLPLILTFLIRNLKYLVPLAVISNLFLIVGLGIVVTYLLVDLPDLEERRPVQSLSQLPSFFGTIMFSVNAIGVTLQLQVNMRQPENFMGTCGVLNRAMFISIAFNTAFGFLGYWKYGDDTATYILKNLPDETLSKCATALFVMAIFCSYALQGYVIIEIIWHSYMAPRPMDSATLWVEYLMRMAMVVASVLCAIAYPDFGLLLSLVGSFCLSQLGLIYPGIINICVCYSDGYGPLKILFWRSLLFIALGFFGGIAGTMASVAAIKQKYDNRILYFFSYFQPH
ncbi:proton-coupled amino acid transporter-like protein CG1139 isoform X1 [Drosophila mojavensis]|uniref:proton-coupled amino acid transporter-like protein CG1139 isoform X1 n=1 Tax=Drosophila mojavensis TaxID=7230 RepID=UPI001CD0F372|nr:proton-coupled amino acid transporter-like protein CG1139 isoform X1 [Drosophila mojavensis]